MLVVSPAIILVSEIGTEEETERYIFEKQIIGTGLRGLKARKIASYKYILHKVRECKGKEDNVEN